MACDSGAFECCACVARLTDNDYWGEGRKRQKRLTSYSSIKHFSLCLRHPMANRSDWSQRDRNAPLFREWSNPGAGLRFEPGRQDVSVGRWALRTKSVRCSYTPGCVVC